MLSLNQKLKLAALALGIFSCFTAHAYFEEKIYKERYGSAIVEDDGSPGEIFKYPMAFVTLQFMISAIFARGLAVDVI